MSLNLYLYREKEITVPTWKIFKNLDLDNLSYPYLELYLATTGYKLEKSNFYGLLCALTTLNLNVLNTIIEGLNTPNNIFDEFISDPKTIAYIETLYFYNYEASLINSKQIEQCVNFWYKLNNRTVNIDKINPYVKTRFKLYNVIYKKNPQVFWKFYDKYSSLLVIDDHDLFEWLQTKIMKEIGKKNKKKKQLCHISA